MFQLMMKNENLLLNNDVKGAQNEREGPSSGKGSAVMRQYSWQRQADLGRHHATAQQPIDTYRCENSYRHEEENGCDGLSPSTINCTGRSTEKKTSKKMSSTANIRIATVNVRTCQDDLKLAEVVKAASQLKIDVLAMQEVRRIHSGQITFGDKSINGWQQIWSGHKRERQHGVASPPCCTGRTLCIFRC